MARNNDAGAMAPCHVRSSRRTGFRRQTAPGSSALAAGAPPCHAGHDSLKSKAKCVQTQSLAQDGFPLLQQKRNRSLG